MSCESSDHIRTYRLPKQAQPYLDNDLKGKNEFVLKWETPEMWTEVKGHSMRLASFTVPTTKGEGDPINYNFFWRKWRYRGKC